MKAKRINEYICIDVDEIIATEMQDILDFDMNPFNDEDAEYDKKVKEAAKIILGHYSV